jgi:hypothetical protein
VNWPLGLTVGGLFLILVILLLFFDEKDRP